MTTFITLEGPPGAGKTTALLKKTLTPARYILAAPRTDLIYEHKQTLDAMFAGTSGDPSYEIIYSGRSDGLPVGTAIEEAIRRHDDDEHCVIMVTHVGLMLADLSNVAGWHLLIDETPEAVISGCMTIPASAAYLVQAYDLAPVKQSEWSRVVVRNDAATKKQLVGDTLLKGLADFHSRARTSHGVLVNTRDWATRIGSGTPVHWFSAFTLNELQCFDSVTIAAAGFRQSLMSLVSQKRYPTLALESETIPRPQRSQSATTIYYFTDSHRGSTSFWAREEGQKCLEAVRARLSNEKLGFWSGNDIVKRRLHELSGECISARSEGTNSYRAYDSCAFIYSSKALPSDVVLKNEFGITAEQIQRAREREHIIQFVMRGIIRNHDFGGAYTVFLYEKQQADDLAAYIRENGLSDVEVLPVEDSEIIAVKRERKPRTRVVLDPRSAAERAEAKRKACRERQMTRRKTLRAESKAAGTYRGRGRPPKGFGPIAALKARGAR